MDKIMGFLLPAHPTATQLGEVGVKVPKPPLHKPPAPASAPASCSLHTLQWRILTFTAGSGPLLLASH